MAWNQSGDDKDKNGKPGDSQKPPELDQLLKQVKDQFSRLLGDKKSPKPGKNNGSPQPLTYWLGFLVIGLIAVVAFSGTYEVPAHQRAVVLGYSDQPQVKPPGLHWYNPLWQQVTLVNVDASKHYKLSSEQVTADGKLINVAVDVGYQIKDPALYVTSLASPVSWLQQRVLASLRQQVGQHPLQLLLSAKPEMLATEIKKQLVKRVSAQQAGIHIGEVKVSQLTLPDSVDKAFAALEAIRTQGEKATQAAEQHQKTQLAGAKQKAQQLLTQAHAYQTEQVDRAEGDVSRFNSLLASYRKAPKVTRDRLYFDTMETLLKRTPKVVITTDKANQLVVPLSRVLEAQSHNHKTATADSSNNATASQANGASTNSQASDAAKAKPVKKAPSLYDRQSDQESGL